MTWKCTSTSRLENPTVAFRVSFRSAQTCSALKRRFDDLIWHTRTLTVVVARALFLFCIFYFLLRSVSVSISKDGRSPTEGINGTVRRDRGSRYLTVKY